MHINSSSICKALSLFGYINRNMTFLKSKELFIILVISYL
ncbi:hypothetical protein FM106_00725 [Brachybacterium faecium]|nr:hypothetical protein FM106_00725 [Brachybacterium faecium]